MNYDVFIEIPNIEAENEEEAEYKAREEAGIRDRGYVRVKKIKE